MHIIVDLIMYALQCNMMPWQIFSLHNTRGVRPAVGAAYFMYDASAVWMCLMVTDQLTNLEATLTN
jgi:hypothetical protein